MARFVSPRLSSRLWAKRSRFVTPTVTTRAGRDARVEPLEPRTLLAFAPAGPEFRVNTATANSQAEPSIAVDGDGDFVVAWESVNQDGGGWGVFAQRFGADGAARGAEFQVNTTTILNQHRPSVAIDADGDFVIAWGSNSFDATTGYDVFGQRYNAAGVRQGGEFRVNNSTADFQLDPAVAMDADGDFVVAWQDKSRDGSGYGVFARRFNPAGVPQGDDIPVNTTTAGNQVEPSVAMDYLGNFVIAWESRLPDNSVEGFYARRFDASGAARGNEFKVNTIPPGGFDGPAVGMDPKGDFAIAYGSFQTGVGTHGFVQRYDSAGTPQGSPVDLQTGRFFEHPSLAMDAAGGFVVTGSASPGLDDDVFARRYNAVGVAQGAQFPVNTILADSQGHPVVGMDPDGDFVIAWQSYKQDGDAYGIYARRYDESTDTAGPIVSDVITAGTQVRPGAVLTEGVTSIVLDFSEDLSVAGGSTGANSVTNRANYGLARAGADVSSQISSVSYGLDVNTGKYQATLTFAAPLAGDYVLTAKQALRDLGGNALDGNFDGAAGGDFTRAFSVRPVIKLGPEFLVNTTTAGNQAEPAVATDGAGNFVITWQGDGDGSGYGVYAKRYSASGVALRVPGIGNTNTEFRVNTNTLNNQMNPAVARNATGSFVVAFDSGPVSGRSVYVKRYGAAGISTAAEAPTTTLTGNFLTPAIAIDASGRYTVAWQQTISGGPILAARFGADGTPLSAAFNISGSHPGAAFAPSVAMNAKGTAVVAWHIYDLDGSLSGVYAQRIDAAGDAAGDVFRVNTFTNDNQAYPSVAIDDAGDFVVAWTSYGGQDGSGLGVYAQRYNATGAPVGGEIRVNTTTNLDQSHASVSMDSDGDFVVAWQSYQEGGSNGIYAQRYAAGGTPVGGELHVNTTTANDQAHPAVAMGPGNTFVVAWQSNLQDGSGLGIYAQRFGPNEPPTTPGIADVAVLPGAPDTLIDLFAAFSDSSDADNQLTYSVVGNTDPSLLLTSTTVSPTAGTLRLHYLPGRAGKTTITVRATDSGGLVTDTTFVVDVSSFGPAGGEFRVNTTTINNQEGASAASDAAGDFVVVWQSAAQDGDGQGVFGQRYNAAGMPQGGEFQVNSFIAGSQFVPKVEMDDAGDFVVAWTSRGQDGAGDEVYAQRYNAAGERQGGEFRVNETLIGDQGNPVVAIDAAGDFVVAWQSGGFPARQVYARRFDASGAPLGGEFPVSTSTTGDQNGASVDVDAAGDFVVAWTSYGGDDGSGSGVFAQRYSAAGVALGGNFQVNTFTTGFQKAPSVGLDRDGDFVIAWQSYQQDGSDYGIYAQRYSPSGLPLGQEFRVNSITNNRQSFPAVGVDADGDFVITWQDNTQDTSTYGVYARRFSRGGLPLGNDFRVNTFTNSFQYFPSIGTDAAGDWVIAWTSDGQDGSNGGIYAQRYVINTAPTGAFAPVTVTEDAPPTAVDLFAAFNDTTNADNTLTYTIVSNSNPALFGALPINGSSGILTLQYAPAKTGTATLVVRATDPGGLFVDAPLVVTVNPGAPSVVARQVFYNHSVLDGNDAAASADDDSAIAGDKQALLPGQTASFANVTSYSRGINGVMIDVRHLPAATTGLSPADFDFRWGVGDPSIWASAPPPFSITIRRGQGVNGRDRITLIWPDGVLTNTYLRISVPAGAKFGLGQPDVFYFGNLIGETGSRNGPLRVDAFDLADTRRNLLSSNPASKQRYDFNRDGVIDARDYLLSRTNQFHALPSLAAPAPAAAAVAPGQARASQRPPRRSVLETPSTVLS